MPRELDIIIFGVTGFTGKHCIPIIHQLLQSGNKFSWGISGRSEERCRLVLQEYQKKLETSFEEIPIIVADVDKPKTLNEMASKTHLVINCCGPFRFYGEAVVKACIEEGTHHIDVSGEPQYMETIQFKYFKEAQEKGVYVISACGLDSIPTDLGIIFLQQKFNGTVNSVETYLKSWSENKEVTGSSVNYGTWESAVHSLAHADELKSIRRQLYKDKLPTFEPKLKAKKMFHKVDGIDGWVLPFLGSDRSVARGSQRYLYEKNKIRPAQIETYFVVNSFLYVLAFIFFGALFSILARFSFGRNLLLKYPEFFSMGLFSKKNPPEEVIESTWFSITIVGKGWKEGQTEPQDQYKTPEDKQMVVQVKGKNPGYGATCLCLVSAALTVLNESDKLPPGGGVYTPGAAFANTSLIEKLNKNGVTFDVLSEKDL